MNILNIHTPIIASSYGPEKRHAPEKEPTAAIAEF
jgi:hypothetical protein